MIFQTFITSSTSQKTDILKLKITLKCHEKARQKCSKSKTNIRAATLNYIYMKNT